MSDFIFSRVADAVFGEMDDRGLFNGVGEDLFDEIKEAVATVAIKAMREPSAQMVTAAETLDPDDLARDEYNCYQISFKDGAMTRIYQTMIDAALAPGIGERAK